MFAAGLDRPELKELNLLTAKPFLYVFNCDEEALTDQRLRAELSELVAPAEAIFFASGLIEIAFTMPVCPASFAVSLPVLASNTRTVPSFPATATTFPPVPIARAVGSSFSGFTDHSSFWSP